MTTRFNRHFITGLLVWLPLAVTVWVLLWLQGFLDGLFASLITGLQAVAPDDASFGFLERLRRVPGLGVVVVLATVFLTGLFVTNVFGQWWLKRWDAMMGRIPIVKSIYLGVKQVSDTMLSPRGQAFRQAVLVEFPRKGMWALAFTVGVPGQEVRSRLGEDVQTVFVPTAPNPTSGYTVIVPTADLIVLKMTIDQALKFIVSMGALVPSGSEPLAAAAPVGPPPAA